MNIYAASIRQITSRGARKWRVTLRDLSSNELVGTITRETRIETMTLVRCTVVAARQNSPTATANLDRTER